jgi:tetratricopeptide (TPR) repeat protein
MARKITKKEIEKPDSFQLALKKIATYVKENRSKIYLISAIITLIIGISCGWYFYRMNYENNAQKLYEKANLVGIKLTMQGGKPDENVFKMYRDVTTQYPGSKAAMMVHYQMGNMYYNLGDIESSIKEYTQFLKVVPDGSDLRALAHVGLGYCYESKKDLKDALESFEKAANSKSVGSFEGITYRNIARIYEEMNNKEKALEYYKKALDKTSDPSMEHLLKRKISIIS